MASDPDMSDAAWPLRTWVLAVLGGSCALAMQHLSQLPDQGGAWAPRLVAAAILFLGVAGLAFGLAWQRGRLFAAIIIALLCGAVAGGAFVWNGMAKEFFAAGGWHIFSACIAAILLLTLFQSAQDGWTGWPARRAPAGIAAWSREAIRYPEVHGHLWTNVLLLALSGLFALLTIGVAYLLDAMFALVKLDFLKLLLREDWFRAVLAGAPFGAALGLLRDRSAIISALQRVAMLVLRVLAPVLAIGIFVFLAALPFTGLAPLWETGGTTPLMLGGGALALFLANAVVADRTLDESRSILLSSSAAALGLFLLPMVGIAIFSGGLRIQQHGLSPERLWALAFLIIASIVAIAYAVAILGRRGWFARLRRTNLHLVYLLTAIALLLSTPFLGFERLATQQQLARLAGGQVAAENFDYKALWFDFGPPGRAAIARLAAHSSDAKVRHYASATRKLEGRWDTPVNVGAGAAGAPLERRLDILPHPVPLDAAMRARLIRFDTCGNAGAACLVRYVPGQDHALIVAAPEPSCEGCKPTVSLIVRDGKGGWSDESRYLTAPDDVDAMVAAIRAGKVEMRPVQRRQMFIDGKPVGDVLPPERVAVP